MDKQKGKATRFLISDKYQLEQPPLLNQLNQFIIMASWVLQLAGVSGGMYKKYIMQQRIVE